MMFKTFSRRLPFPLIALFLFAFTLSYCLLYIQAFPQVASNSDELAILFQFKTFLAGHFSFPSPTPAELFEAPTIIDHPVWASRNWPYHSLPLIIGHYFFSSPLVGQALFLAFYSILISLFFRKERSSGVFYGLILLVALNSFYVASFVNFYRSGLIAAFAAALTLLGFTSQSKWSSLLYYGGIFILSQSRGGEGAIFFITSLPMFIFFQKKFLSRAFIAMSFILFLFLTTFSILFYSYKTTGKLWPHPNTQWSLEYQRNNPISFLPNREEVHSVRPEVERYFSEYEDHMREEHVSGFKRALEFNIKKMLKYLIFHFGIFSTPFLILGFFCFKSIEGLSRKNLFLLFGLNTAFVFCIIYDLRDYTAVIMPMLHILAISTLSSISKVRNIKLRLGLHFCALILLSVGWIKNTNRALAFSSERPMRSNFFKPDFEKGYLVEGKNYVIVETSPEHSPHDIWVYNNPNLSTSQNIFIWSALPGMNVDREKLSAYKGRTLWCIYIDNSYPIMLHQVDRVVSSCRESWSKKQTIGKQ